MIVLFALTFARAGISACFVKLAAFDALKTHITRGRPFGDVPWTQKIATRLNVEHTLRAPGRQVGWRKPIATPGKRKK